MKIELRSEIPSQETVLETVLRNRNIDSKNIQNFCDSTFDNVQNPFDYVNMELAITYYINAIENNKKIGFLIDSDCDGYCSASALIQATMGYFNHKNFEAFMHRDKEHGLTNDIMESIFETDIEVLIIADASSGDYAQHKILKDKGITVIVLDHHLADKYSEDAIVVNNQLQDNSNKTLSGMGMVQKFFEAIQLKYGHKLMYEFMDLTAVALVGDCMDMKSLENRFYFNYGMRNLKNKLLQQLFIGDKKRDYKATSFDIVPTINAFIRVGSNEEKCDLFYALCGIEDIREITIRGLGELKLSLQEYIKRMSSRIKSLQTKMIKEALDNEDLELFSEGLPFAVAILSDETNKNLTGLIASRFVEELKKPTLVLKRYDNKLKGSARTIDEFKNFKDYISNIDLFDYAAGHQEAFGVGISYSNFLELKDRMKNEKPIEGRFFIDKEYKDNLYPFDVLSISALKHQWSRGFEEPKFFIEISIDKIEDFKIVGNKKDTIRFKVNNITYIKFKCNQSEIDNINEIIDTKDSIKIVGVFGENLWNDNLYPQVEVDSIL